MAADVKKKSKKLVLPTKKTINLCKKEKPKINLAVAIPLILVIILGATLFSQFAVIGRFNTVNAARASVAKLQSERDEIADYVKNYNDVLKEYNRYSTKWMSAEELGTVQRIDMLDLVEEEFTANFRVLDISANGNVISLKLAGVNLEDMSGIVSSLYSRSDVRKVELSSATNKETYTVTTYDNRTETIVDEVVSIVITMKIDEGGDR